MAILRFDRIQHLLDEEVAPQDGEVTTWDSTVHGWVNRVPPGGTTPSTGNIDGGAPDSQYGGITPIDGGTV